MCYGVFLLASKQMMCYMFQFLKPSNALLNRLSKFLKLTTSEDVALSLFLKNSTKTELVNQAKQHLKRRFLTFIHCYLDAGKNHLHLNHCVLL